MKKMLGFVKGCLTAIGLLVVLAIVFGGGCSGSSSSSDDTGSSNQAQEQTASEESKDEEQESTKKKDKEKNNKNKDKDKKSKEKESKDEAKEEEPEAPVQTVYHVGDKLDDDGLVIVYEASGEHVEDNEFLQPEDGYKYVYLKLAFINETKSDKSVSVYSFDGYADGYAVDMYYGGDDELSATLSSGRSTEGYLYFEVPVDMKEFEVEYTPNMFFSDKFTFAYDGEKDSGYVLEANGDRTEGAVQPGESVEGTGVTISYLSVAPFTSDNMFVQPRDGYGYVSVELEFENTGTRDRSVSSLSFDCYADGVACEQTYIRDDDLSGSISAGRKLKGTVTFEVPNDAQVVEVEYEDNVWTSNRIVFTAR